MSTTSTPPSGGSSQMRVPVAPHSDAVFVAQPLAQGYMPALRAVATSMLYRYTGINTGYGCAVPAGSCDAALAACNTPLHLLQVSFAEWLAVYVGLLSAAAASDDSASTDAWSLTSVAASPVTTAFGFTTLISSQHELATDAAAQSTCVAGLGLPSLAAVLGVLIDWYGSVAPVHAQLHHGSVASVVDGLLPVVHSLRAGSAPAHSPVRRALEAGAAVVPEMQVRLLNRLLTRSRTTNAHPCAIAVGTVLPADVATVRVRDATSGAPTVASPADAAVALPETLTDTVATAVSVPTAVFDMLLGTQHAFVAHVFQPAGAWWPLLPAQLADAALQHVALRATAETLVAAVATGSSGPSPHALREVRTRTRMLYCAAPVDVVDAAVSAASSAAFGGDTLSGISAPPPSPAPLPLAPPAPPTHATTEEPVAEHAEDKDSDDDDDDSGDDDDDDGHSMGVATSGCSKTVVESEDDNSNDGPWDVLQPALRQQAAAGRKHGHEFVLSPSRLATTGSATVTLYYSHEAWCLPTTKAAVQAVQSVFDKVEMVRCAASGAKEVYLVNRNTEQPLLRLVPLCSTEQGSGSVSAVKQRHKVRKAYVCRPLEANMAAVHMLASPVTERLLQQPLQSVSFSREDLLYIATAASDDVRQALQTLWAARADTLKRYVDDSLATQMVGVVVAGMQTRVRGAAQWAEGIVVELLLPLAGLAPDVCAALATVYKELCRPQCVAQFGSDNVDHNDDGDDTDETLVTAVCVRNKQGGLQVQRRFVVDGLDLVLQPPTAEEGWQPAYKNVVAWSVAPLHGICLTVTQVALCAVLGSPVVQAALGTLAGSCDPERINMFELQEWCKIDMHEVRRQLQLGAAQLKAAAARMKEVD